MNPLNRLFLDHFATPVGIIAGAMLYRVEIDPEDANGEDQVYAQIIIQPNNISIFIKQFIDQPNKAPLHYRRNRVVITHDEYLGEAIQLATMESFNGES